MLNNKVALITGVTGQDGAYLSEFLLNKGYEVHGIKRRSSSFNTERIDHLYQGPQAPNRKFILHYGDLSDSMSLVRIIKKIQPDEIYNLGAQSHVGVSFEVPEYTANVDAIGTLRILDSIKTLGLEKKTKYYQAGTSEMFGATKPPQNEKSIFYPRSPYAVAKLYAHWITINYREAYDIFACNGILFNHESPLRGETFVTRKITRAVSRIAHGLQDKVFLGNLDAKRDWGHAKDYVEGMYLILQQEKPEDYCIATGVQYSVREFIETAWNFLGRSIRWEGKGVNEKGYDKDNGKLIVAVDSQYFRPTEVETLLGDATKAREKLGWEPKITFSEMVDEMMENDIGIAKRDSLIKKHGFKSIQSNE